ncbi:hypothetical protein [Xanthobacter sediminis]
MVSEPMDAHSESVPAWTPEHAARLREVIDGLGSIARAASIAGITPEQLSKWRDGKARASFLGLAALAQAAGYSLDWLATGESAAPRSSPVAAGAIDEELLGRVTEAIVRLHKEEGTALAPIDLGRLAGRRYAEIVSATDDPGERVTMIKLVIAQLRAELRAAPEASEGSRGPG